MDAKQLQDLIAKAEKALSTQVGGSPRDTLIRENLASGLTSLVDKETPIRDRLMRLTGSGIQATWNVLTGITGGNSAFAEGGTPNEDDATYALRAAIYKELGKTKTITDKMIAAGKSFADVEAEQTENAMREVIQDEEQYIITGNATSNVLQFDGLQTQIITNVTDDANDPLGWRTDLVDKEVENLINVYGVRPTAIYIGYALQTAINQSLSGEVRVNLDVTNQVGTGLEVAWIQTSAGRLPLVQTFAIAERTSGTNKVQDMYIVTEKWRGSNVVYMEDLYTMGKTPLAKTGAATKFMVTECTVLVNRAEEFHAKVTNIRTK